MTQPDLQSFNLILSNPPPLLPNKAYRPSRLSYGLRWSIIGHALLLLAICIKNFVLPERVIPYVPTLKVDLIGLPDTLKKDLVNPNHSTKMKDRKGVEYKEQKATKNASASSEMLSHLTESIQKKNLLALERIRALSKIQASVQQEGDESENDSKHRPSHLHSIIKGNRLSPGSSLEGEAKEALLTSYYDTVRDHLKLQWALPPWIARQNFSVQILLHLDAQGKVMQFHFQKQSGNLQFDEAVKHAIEESDPFPTPPTELVNTLVSDGIRVGFPL